MHQQQTCLSVWIALTAKTGFLRSVAAALGREAFSICVRHLLLTSWCGVGLSSTVLAPAALATMDADACSAAIDATMPLAIMLADA